MRDTYIPLFASALNSSVWGLPPDALKVFLTLSLLADPEGEVSASIDGVARAAVIPVQDVVRILKTLEGPDEFSKDMQRNPANGGRRIERIAGGWRVVNIEWYRAEARRQAELASKRRWWAEKGAPARSGARATQTQTQTETQTQTQTRTDPPSGEGELENPPRAAPKPKRGKPRSVTALLPDDFAPNAEHATIARQRGVDLAEEFSKMRDWALSKGARKADWGATLRNWLRRAEPSRGAIRGRGEGRSRNSDALDYAFNIATKG